MKIVVVFILLIGSFTLKSQDTVQIGVYRVMDIYEAKIYKELELNAWRLLLNDKKNVVSGVVFFNASTNASATLNFEKEMKIETLPDKDLPLGNNILKRKIKNTVIKRRKVD